MNKYHTWSYQSRRPLANAWAAVAGVAVTLFVTTASIQAQSPIALPQVAPYRQPADYRTVGFTYDPATPVQQSDKNEALSPTSEQLALKIQQLESQIQQMQSRFQAEPSRQAAARVPPIPARRPAWRSLGPIQSNGRSIGSPYFMTPQVIPAVSPTESAAARSLVETGEPGFPLRVSDASINARAAVVVDSTRLDPAAAGYFLPSAIPVKGEPFYGLGERATVQGQGTSAELSWLADLGTPSLLTGSVRVEIFSATANTFRVFTPQAWLRWDYLLFGVSDSVFTDMDAIPDTIDLGGPTARPYIRGGQPQLRYSFLRPANQANDPTGWYGNVSLEMPGADVYAADGQGYTSFSRYPDMAAALKYQSGEWVTDRCTGATGVYNEYWHVQLGTLFRDLGVEKSDNTVREETFGWGTQLSGRYTVFRDCNPCEQLRDYAYFGVTYGHGIGHYFNDLQQVNPVNDAAYNTVANTLTALPVFAFFVAYQHDWVPNVRSTAVYSRIELDSQQIPGGNTTVLPYHRGDYASINLMYHSEPCGPKPPPDKDNSQHHFFSGVEYLFGQKENLSGAFGQDHRIMFVIAATK